MRNSAKIPNPGLSFRNHRDFYVQLYKTVCYSISLISGEEARVRALSLCVTSRKHAFLSKSRITDAVSKRGNMLLTRPVAHGEKLCGLQGEGLDTNSSGAAAH